MIVYFLAAYLILNGIVFLIYGVDKYKAVHNKWRIPETTLLVIAVIGVIGAFAGMHVFHHKTRKPKFYVGVPVIFFLEVLAVIGIFCAGGKYMGNTAKKENAAKTASLSSTSREGLKRGGEFTIEKQEFKKSLSQESFSIPFNTMDECYRVGDLFVSFDSGTKSKIKIYFWNPKTMKVPAVYTYRENVENYDDSLFAANESGQYVIAQIAEKLIVFNFLGKAMKEILIEEGRPTDIIEKDGKQYILTSSTLYVGSIQSGFRKVGSNSDKEEKKNAEEDNWSLEFLFSCGDYVYVSMTVPAKYHSFSWLWQISLKNGEWKKIMDEMLDFSFDTDAKEVAAGIEIGEKNAEVLYYKFHEDGTYEKKKIKAIPGAVENGVIYTASKKEFLAISVKDNKKTVLKHVGRYCEIADLKYENLSNVRQEKKGKIIYKVSVYLSKKPLKNRYGKPMPDYDNYYCYDLETKQTQTVNTGVSYIDFDYAEGKTYMKNRGKWLTLEKETNTVEMAIDYVYGDNAILNKRVVRVVQKDKKEKVVSDKVYTFCGDEQGNCRIEDVTGKYGTLEKQEKWFTITAKQVKAISDKKLLKGLMKTDE